VAYFEAREAIPRAESIPYPFFRLVPSVTETLPVRQTILGEFAALTGFQWHPICKGGVALPDAKLGWVFLGMRGWASGNDLQHAAVQFVGPRRRYDCSVSGIRWDTNQEPGDRSSAGQILCGRPDGLLARFILHQNSIATDCRNTISNWSKGERCDFVVRYSRGSVTIRFPVRHDLTS